MSKFINIGHGNMIAAARIVAVVSPESQPIKRLVQDAKEEGRAIDVTGGRKTRAVLVADTGHVIMCALMTETITARLNGTAEPAVSAETDEDECDPL
ncbi:MAG: DUF370 domain-containing protein [Clostridia bacterium]|nr:DUF370 domain-containing protein [Clostridia bacterium]